MVEWCSIALFTSRNLMLVGAVALVACSGSDSTKSSAPTATVAPEPGSTVTSVTTQLDGGHAPDTAATKPPTDERGDVPIETSDPNVISRRTEGLDVLVIPDGVELPPNYTQAAVPVDAFAADEMIVSTPTGPVLDRPRIPSEAFDVVQPTVVGDAIEVSLSILSCRLVAVWVLPHPDEIVVGYEEYPELTCAIPLDHAVTFDIPLIGVNSEGAWDYTVMPPVVPLRKVGLVD